MAPARRTIKKYPNRRLYDTGISSYVTLDDVRQLVLEGEDFEVLDARSGADLTRSVLLQIIAGHETPQQPVLSPQLLRQVIRLHEDTLQGLAGAYLERHLEAFIEQHAAGRHQPDQMPSSTPDKPSGHDMDS